MPGGTRGGSSSTAVACICATWISPARVMRSAPVRRSTWTEKWGPLSRARYLEDRGLDTPEACTEVVAAARQGIRDAVCCIVLGRGAEERQVVQWLGIAASVPGFDGVAVGRTPWEEALRDLIAGKVDRQAAVHTIANRYLETVRRFVG